jgi:hypothetical protein
MSTKSFNARVTKIEERLTPVCPHCAAMAALTDEELEQKLEMFMDKDNTLVKQ